MKIRILSLFILIFVACKSYQPQATSSSTNTTATYEEPTWVVRKPASTEYYIGVGNAPLSDPDYQVNAKLEALDDLASEIQVIIESNSLLQQIESSVGYSEQFQSAIKSTTNQSLELHEQIASWSDDKLYWVQYRLSKSTFAQLKNTKKEAVLTKAKNHYIKGRTAEEEGSIIQSLHFYAQSIETLGGYLNEPNTVQINASFVDIPVEAYARIISILANISLESSALTYQLAPKESTKRVTVTALSEMTQPVRGLSIRINESESKVTNQHGDIYLDINRRMASERMILEADMEFLTRYPIAHALTRGLNAPMIEIHFVVPTIKISVSADEQNLDEKISQSQLVPVIKKVLTEKGYHVVESNSDYRVEIRSNTRKGGEISGLFTSYLDITLDIKDKSGDRVLSDSFSNIKGIHSSYQKAGMKAYQNASVQLKAELNASLDKNFINKD